MNIYLNSHLFPVLGYAIRKCNSKDSHDIVYFYKSILHSVVDVYSVIGVCGRYVLLHVILYILF